MKIMLLDASTYAPADAEEVQSGDTDAIEQVTKKFEREAARRTAQGKGRYIVDFAISA